MAGCKIAVLIGVLVLIVRAQSFFCSVSTCKKPCGLIYCPNKEGWGMDLCGCCYTCLQGPGERCGGPLGVAGQCGKKLACQKSDPDDFNSEGVCVEAIPLGGECGDLASNQGVCADHLVCQSENPGDNFVTNSKGVCVEAILFGGQCGDLAITQGVCADHLVCQSENPGDNFDTNRWCLNRNQTA